MKLYINIKQGRRKRFWWKLVDKHNHTRAMCPPPGFDTTEDAYEDARAVATADLGDPDGATPVVLNHHPWWAFWR